MILRIPKRPLFMRDGSDSPDVVLAMDEVRNAKDFGDEFNWFAMEYPRILRYHLGHAEHRLDAIYKQYEHYYAHFQVELDKIRLDGREGTVLSSATSNSNVDQLYWDFEAFLSAISCGLDILARILTTAFRDPVPVSFNKFVRKTSGPFQVILSNANKSWVGRFKDYRDCFVHYTPIDRLPMIGITRYSDGFELRCKLPTNPNKRETEYFKYNRRTELLRYSLHVHRKFRKLESDIAGKIIEQYNLGLFPIRTTNLFGVSVRQRD